MSEGEQLGEVKVKKILKDKVIIGRENEEWQLR